MCWHFGGGRCILLEMLENRKATVFEFVDREIDADTGRLFFGYAVHFDDKSVETFTESVDLGGVYQLRQLPEQFVADILEDLHLILGVSYYKLFCPPEFSTDIRLSVGQATFWNTIYTRGLSEFLYRNEIDPKVVAQFKGEAGYQRQIHQLSVDEKKILTGIGGGKDSIVALELLRDFEQTGFTVETGKENIIASEVADIASVPLVTVGRTLDPKLLSGVPGSYGGHVPVSAMYAFLGVLQAALGGQSAFVVSNEYSSNFGNFVHEGNEVNHQWSKSSEFENIFQTYLRENLTIDVKYFSLLRPFYELRIVQKFVEVGEKYFQTFSSCNRNFTHTHEGESRWCGECPKCAFAFLMLGAFLPKEEVVGILKKDLFTDESLKSLFVDILGFGTMKPFDCVGTFDESRLALSLAYPKWSDSAMANELMELVNGVDLNQDIFKTHKAEAIPSRFRLYGMESALILGYGREGKASEQYLKSKWPNVQIGIADEQDGAGYLEKQEDYDIVIKTPVIPQEKVTRQHTTATHFFFSEVPRQNIIGVTGSKGKSTTATLIYDMLEAGGKTVRLLGNIGVPAIQSISELAPREDEIFVMELSSYQTADLDVSPHIAVLTALFPEHLDHHGSLESYYEAKHNLVRFQSSEDVFIYPEGFPLLAQWASEGEGESVMATEVPFAVDNIDLKGKHNLSNVALAYAVAERFGVSKDSAEKAVREFVALPHRLQYLGKFKDIEFYDDSISTTPESTIAGLRAIKNVHTVFLGGEDRGLDFGELEKELRQSEVKTLVLFPNTGERMLGSEDGFKVLHTSDMEEAVKFAFANTPEGKAVLLSPASPSYNLFKNFEARGQAFEEAVKNYGKI